MPGADLAKRAAWSRRRRRRAGWPGFSTAVSPVTFPSSPLTTRVYIALGADLTASHLTWNWLDITEWVRHDLGISVVFGRRDEFTKVTASRCQLKLENIDGRFSRRNPLGPHFGLLSRNTPIWIQLDPGSGFVDQYEGYVNDWPNRWSDESGNDSYVVIQCAGVMRRLGQGENLKSPMFRSISGVAENDYVPHAYWSMEDGTDATQIASGLSGGVPLAQSGTVTLAAESTLTGSSPLLTLATGASLTAVIPAHSATGKWIVQFVFRIPTAPAASIDIAEVLVSGSTAVRYEISLSSGGGSSITVAAFDSSGAQISSVGAPFDTYGRWFTFALAASQYTVTPTDLLYTLHFFDALGISEGPYGNTAPNTTAGTVTQVRLLAGEGMNYGHLALFTDAQFDVDDDVSATAPAMYGHTGEMAHERIARLCREEGVPIHTTAARSALMGPQSNGTLLTVLRECETADQGVLYEHQYGFGYQSLDERYNQPVVFELDFDQRHIGGLPEPADDDQRIRNQWTIGRPEGSTATVRNQDSVDADGLYDDADTTVRLETDAQLAPHAGWRVHVGTVDEDRWPRLPLKLHGTPGLIPGWTATKLGDRVTVANPPAQMAPDTIDAIVEGWQEHWDTVQWNVSLNTSPASPYQIGVYGSDTIVSRYDSAHSTLAVGVAAGVTTLSVATEAGHKLWITSAAFPTHFPFDVRCAGIRLTVTDITSTTSPQTFTVTRNVDGIDKALAAGEQIRLWKPARYGL